MKNLLLVAILALLPTPAIAQVVSTSDGPTSATTPISVTIPVALNVEFTVPSNSVSIPGSFITPGAELVVESPVTNTGGLPIGINIDLSNTLPDWLTYTKPAPPLIMPGDSFTLDLIFTVGDTIPPDAAEVTAELDINAIQIGPTPAPAPVSL